MPCRKAEGRERRTCEIEPRAQVQALPSRRPPAQSLRENLRGRALRDGTRSVGWGVMQRLLCVLLAVPALAACPQLAGMGSPTKQIEPPPRPEVKLSAITLEARPTNARLAAYFCMQATGGGIAGVACRVFGEVPRKDDLRFTFRVQLEARNPATIPMPVVSALLAFTAYPADTGGQNLGSVCVEMCKDT